MYQMIQPMEGEIGNPTAALAPAVQETHGESCASRQPNNLALLGMGKSMYALGTPVRRSDFLFEAKVAIEKMFAKRLKAGGRYHKQIMVQVMISHRLFTYFSEKTVHLTVSSANLGMLSINAVVCQGKVCGVLESFTNNGDSGVELIISNVTGGRFKARGKDLSIGSVVVVSGNEVVNVDVKTKTPVSKIASRPIQYLVKAHAAPNYETVQNKLLKQVNGGDDIDIIPVYLKDRKTDEIYMPLTVGSAHAATQKVYKLNITELYHSNKFIHTDVTVEQLETYDPLAAVFWSRAIIFRSCVIGERWEFAKVSINPNLFGVQSARPAKRRRRK